MIRAHEAMRSGNYDDAITLAGAAFESVLKTICDIKSWAYDKDRDTCRRFVAGGHSLLVRGLPSWSLSTVSSSNQSST